MSQHIGPRTISAIGGSIKRVGPYRIHTFPSELVTDGLVLNLDAGDPRSYPSSGTTWTDLSGNGNNGTLVNGPTYSNADGGSLVFGNPTTTKVTINTSQFGGQSFAISMWFNIDTIPNDYHMLLGGSDYAGGDGLGIGHYLYQDTIRTWVGGVGNLYHSESILSTGTWYNLVVIREYNVAWKWYLNGTLINTHTSSALTQDYSSQNSAIGQHYNNGSYPFFGKISSVKVYNRALSPAEVAQNYDALRVRYGSYTSTFTPICAGGEGKVEVLCVAGGGGGASGGGGAGGLIYNSSFGINSNAQINVTVGSGGTSGNCDIGNGSAAIAGSNSTFDVLTSIGGGIGGQGGGVRTGGNGGSGGGAAANGAAANDGGTGTIGQGNNGGGNGGFTTSPFGVGGGGGAGSVGVSATSARAFPGGSGLSYSISGESKFYAGGGGGGAYYGSLNGIGGSGVGGDGAKDAGLGINAIPNTGSGGGGGSATKLGGNGSNGTVIVRYPATDYNVEVLVVGGGGGGGTYLNPGGGGGAGGLIYISSIPVSSGKKINITVGNGGKGGILSGSSYVATNGGNSIFANYVAIGGGKGSDGQKNGSNGGSGGGGNYEAISIGGIGVVGQGNNGGNGNGHSVGYYATGGGGGAGEPGGNGLVGNYSGNGGNGLAYNITGSSVYYAGGGGGAVYTSGTAGSGGLGGGGTGGSSSVRGQDGIANTGGGGGGGSNAHAGNGGSGIVIIAYKGPQRGIGGVVDTTSRPGYTLHKFTTTGTDFFIP